MRQTLLAALLPLAVALALVPASPGHAQAPSTADLVQRIDPAVVEISPIARTGSDSTGIGTGFVFDRTGLIATNAHVIENARTALIAFSGGDIYVAQVVGVDQMSDLAVLKIVPRKPLVALKFASSAATRPGDPVSIYGNGFGLGLGLTTGVVSARDRDLGTGIDAYFQTDAAINQGQSGGPMVNAAGEVVGIASASVSPTEASAGVGFAIASDVAAPILAELARTGDVKRVDLAAGLQDLDMDLALAVGLTKPRGVLISRVVANGLAARSGFKPGDTLVAIDGVEIVNRRHMRTLLNGLGSGKKVRVDFYRQGKKFWLPVTTEYAAVNRAPAKAAAPVPVLGGFGINAVDLTPGLRTRLQLDDAFQGLLVTQLEPGTDAETKLLPGDVIVSFAFETPRSVVDWRLKSDLLAKSSDKPVMIQIWRGGVDVFLAIKPKPLPGAYPAPAAN